MPVPEAPTSMVSDTALPPAERFDFGQAGHVSTDEMRSVRATDEQFARSLTHALSAWLRTDLAITPQPLQQGSFQEFLDSAEQHYLLPLDLPEHHARGMLAWPLRLVPEVVDLLLGGRGGVPELGREMTEVEESVLGAVLEIVVRERNAAWHYIGMRMVTGERERDGQERRMLPPQEKMVLLRFHVTVPGAGGDLLFCVPVSALNNTLRTFSATRAVRRPRNDQERERVEAALRHARLRASLCFQTVRVPAAELQAMQPGSLLRLPLSSSAPAELRLSNVPCCAAQAVRTGERRGARLQHPLPAASIGNPSLLPALSPSA